MWLAKMLLIAALTAASLSVAAQSAAEFQPYTSYQLGQEAQAVAIADINGDGRDDAAVAALPSGLFVFYQLGDGSLASPIQLAAPNTPLGLAAGDINGDTRNDIAVGGADGRILLYYQQADGTLGPAVECAAYGATSGITIGDFNSDGLMDVAACTSSWSAVFVLYQGPDGTFGLPSFYAYSRTNPRSIAALDCNSDGRTDLSLLVDDQICLFEQNPAGGFAQPYYLAARWAGSVAVGDVTGDGLPDLTFSIPGGQPDGAIGVYSRTGSDYSLAVRTAYDYSQSVAVADIDSDGRNDVIAVHPGFDALSVHHQSPDGSLGDWTLYPMPYSNYYQPQALAVGDLNGDRLPDVAVADPYNGLVVLTHAAVTSHDTTAPLCVAALEGTLGTRGWYVSPVTVTLLSDDQGGSGVARTQFTVNGRNWTNYTDPVLISRQGTTKFGYRAADVAGNESEPKWVTVRIDARKPTLRLTPWVRSIPADSAKTVRLPVSILAHDGVSGLCSVRLKVTDEYSSAAQEVAVRSCVVTVPLSTSCRVGDSNGRTYTLTLTAADRAGNTNSVSSTVTIAPGRRR